MTLREIVPANKLRKVMYGTDPQRHIRATIALTAFLNKNYWSIEFLEKTVSALKERISDRQANSHDALNINNNFDKLIMINDDWEWAKTQYEENARRGMIG